MLQVREELPVKRSKAKPSAKKQKLHAEVNEPGALLSLERIEEFLDSLRKKGRVEGTLEWYRRSLKYLYEALPEDKHIRKGTLEQWREKLLQAGYAPHTVNLFASVANSYLKFYGSREYQVEAQLKCEEELQPELSRAEYLRLLKTAKLLGKERVYLLIKLFASTGLPLQDIGKVTVETVKAGRLAISPGGIRQYIRFPGCLQQELLDYARRNGQTSGPIFLTRTGAPITRANVTNGIRQLCSAAQIPEEKGNPRCLKKLYQTTRAGIEANISLLVDQAQDRLMEQEQLSVGWEQDCG